MKKTYHIEVEYGSEYQYEVWHTCITAMVYSFQAMMCVKHKKNTATITITPPDDEQ